MRRRVVAGLQGSLAVEESGGGPLSPVVFLHSDGGARGHWRQAMEALAPRRRVVAFDIRGHGQSEPPTDGDLSFAGRSDDVAAVAHALDLRRFVLVGHSGAAGSLSLTLRFTRSASRGCFWSIPSPTRRRFPQSRGMR